MSQMKHETDDNANRINVLMPCGFHGDQKLMKLVDHLVPNVSHFVETGTEAGSTVGYMARMYPSLQCWTCEADEKTYETAKANTANLPAINHHLGESEEWLEHDFAPHQSAYGLFWLDAHSHGWGCPLGKEVNTILKNWPGGYILMDDFQVPDRPEFGFDWYDSFGKVNWETIEKDIQIEQYAKIKETRYPAYECLPGGRGWMLLRFGDVPEVGEIEGVEMVRG